MTRALAWLLLACFLFGAAAAPAAFGEDDLARLVADLCGKDHSRRSTAMGALQRKRDPRAIPLIVEALPDASPLGRYYAVLVLDSYPPKDVKGVYLGLAKSEDPWLRFAAGSALWRMGEDGAAVLVVRALREPVPDSATRLRMMGRVHMVDDARVRDAVRSFLEPESDPTLLGSALWALSIWKDEAAEARIRKLLGERRAGVRAMAAAWLYRFGEEAAGETLATALRTGEVGPSEFSRVSSFLTTARRVPAEVLDAVTEMLASSDNVSTLSQGVRLLANARHRKAVPAIRELLGHDNRIVARAAFDALTTLGGGLDAETLRPLLAAKDLDRRLWAADALRRMDDLSGLPMALEILSAGETNQRSEAAKILGGFRKDEVVEPLLTALTDENRLVRMYALNSLRAVLQALFPYRRLDLESTGYSYGASPASTKAAVEKLRAWWRANRTKDW